MDTEQGLCPTCNEAGIVGVVCESCLGDVVARVDDDVRELLSVFEQLPSVVIGEGRRRATDIVERVDPDEARYNAKYGLDKNGDPMAVNKVLAQREEELYSMTLSEGFDLLDMDGDDDGSALYEENEVINQSGFNQW